MTRRLWLYLTGEPEPYVQRSATGRGNQAKRGALGSYYADRALLLITIPWLILRFVEWQRIRLRPDVLYEPRMWLAELLFPAPPSTSVYYVLLGVAITMVAACYLRPNSVTYRLGLTAAVLVVSVPQHGFGHVAHSGHLLLLGHVYSVFRPIGKPQDLGTCERHEKGYAWFLLGLLAIYTASGFWKVVDMTIRDVIKPGVTWLDTEAMLATSIASMRSVDLSMTVPRLVESFDWAFPIGYVILTVIFTGSFIAAFRRPLLFVVVPTIVAFHILNAVFMYVLFVFTIFVAVAVLSPYEFMLPGVHRRLVSVSDIRFAGRGHNALFVIRYADGSEDLFYGFYAYRERLRRRSTVLAAPLYYPGLGWCATRFLEFIGRR